MRSQASKASRAISFATATHWRTPVPSRSTRNLILPDERFWASHPASATVSPTWDPSSEMYTKSRRTALLLGFFPLVLLRLGDDLLLHVRRRFLVVVELHVVRAAVGRDRL